MRASGRPSRTSAQLLARRSSAAATGAGFGSTTTRSRRRRPSQTASSRRYALGVNTCARTAQLGVARDAQNAARAAPPSLRWNASTSPPTMPRRRARSKAGSAVSLITYGRRASVAPARAAPEHARRVDDVGLGVRVARSRARSARGRRPSAAAARPSAPDTAARAGGCESGRHHLDVVPAVAEERRDVGRVARRAADVRRPDAGDDEHVHRASTPASTPRRRSTSAIGVGCRRPRRGSAGRRRSTRRRSAHAREHGDRPRRSRPSRDRRRRRAAARRPSRRRASRCAAPDGRS